MTTPKRPILKLAKVPANLPPIEYRVAWNEAAAHWDILRNSLDTKQSRRKKQSAIDLAISSAKGETGPKVIVTIKDKDGGKAKLEWSAAAPKPAPE